ncbi:hypothetical protein CASFOL_030177 [Castilleja foliolosa]|uniref:Desiccation-related protein PCC13-62 n=1 Tax=Castilleja foliolosa TaxID=1961234 RepID=A0ABD3CAM3_9LAMI
MVAGLPRPPIDISPSNFAAIMDNVVGHALISPFDPYANEINYLLASYLIPYVGLTGYVGAASNLQDPAFKKLVAGLLGVESGQDAVIRTLLYQQGFMPVFPWRVNPKSKYGRFYTVADFTNMISAFRDKLGGEGLKDEGIWVDQRLGAEGKVNGNVLAGDEYSMSYERSPNEILRIVYGNNHGVPGGFFPNGAGGKFAKYM